jgi:hypothetical protein
MTHVMETRCVFFEVGTEFLNIIWMRFQVLTAANMNMTVFWDVALCSLVQVYLRFRGAYCPDDGGSKRLCNDGKLLPYYTAQPPRRQSSSLFRWVSASKGKKHYKGLPTNGCKMSGCNVFSLVHIVSNCLDGSSRNARPHLQTLYLVFHFQRETTYAEYLFVLEVYFRTTHVI